MGRFAGAVIAGDHHAAIAGKAGENGERGGTVKAIIRIDIRHVRIGLGKSRNFKVTVDTEDLANRHFHVGQADGLLRIGHGGGHQSSVAQGTPRTGLAFSYG